MHELPKSKRENTTQPARKYCHICLKDTKKTRLIYEYHRITSDCESCKNK